MFQFPRFAPYRLYIQRQVTARLSQPRFRIQRSPDQSLIASSPEHIAGFRVFRRFSMPRHPPYTLKNLTTFIDHRRRDIDLKYHSPDLDSGVSGRAKRLPHLLQLPASGLANQ
jgi:hypothetical protein